MADEAKYTYVRQVDDIVILRPKKNLLGDKETDELEQLLEAYDKDDTRALVINLADVSIISSMGISRIVRGHIQFSRRGARVGVCDLTRRVENVFAVVKLCMWMPCFETEAKAIEAFQQPQTTG